MTKPLICLVGTK